MICKEGFTWHRETHHTEYNLTKSGIIPDDSTDTWTSEYEKLKNSQIGDQFTNSNFNDKLKTLIQAVNANGGWVEEINDPLSPDTQLKKRKVSEKITAHKFRHYYTNYLVQKHGFDGAQSVVGHISEDMTKHYSGCKQDIRLAREIQAQN